MTDDAKCAHSYRKNMARFNSQIAFTKQIRTVHSTYKPSTVWKWITYYILFGWLLIKILMFAGQKLEEITPNLTVEDWVTHYNKAHRASATVDGVSRLLLLM